MLSINKVKEIEKKIVVNNDAGQPHLVVAVIATLYYWKGYEKEKREAIVRCFEEYKNYFGDKLRWEKHPKTFTYHKIEKGEVPDMPAWLHNLTSNDSYEFHLHGSEHNVDANQFNIKVYGSREWENELSYMSLSVPMSWVEENTEAYASMFTNMCDILEPFHGYSGLGLVTSVSNDAKRKVDKYMYEMAQAYKCLEIDRPIGHVSHLEEGIKGVSWMTVLSDEFLSKLGGLDNLVKKLGTDNYIYRKFKKGCIIQTGERICDMGEDLKVPEPIIKLNTALKSIRAEKIGSFSTGSGGADTIKFDTQSTTQWLTRFD